MRSQSTSTCPSCHRSTYWSARPASSACSSFLLWQERGGDPLHDKPWPLRRRRAGCRARRRPGRAPRSSPTCSDDATRFAPLPCHGGPARRRGAPRPAHGRARRHRHLDGGRHLVVQVETGKTLSADVLVPAIAVGSRIVVATATKALQDQLAAKDLPFLQHDSIRGDGAPFDWAVLRSCNYRVPATAARDARPRHRTSSSCEDFSATIRDGARAHRHVGESNRPDR